MDACFFTKISIKCVSLCREKKIIYENNIPFGTRFILLFFECVNARKQKVYVIRIFKCISIIRRNAIQGISDNSNYKRKYATKLLPD